MPVSYRFSNDFKGPSHTIMSEVVSVICVQDCAGAPAGRYTAHHLSALL